MSVIASVIFSSSFWGTAVKTLVLPITSSVENKEKNSPLKTFGASKNGEFSKVPNYSISHDDLCPCYSTCVRQIYQFESTFNISARVMYRKRYFLLSLWTSLRKDLLGHVEKDNRNDCFTSKFKKLKFFSPKGDVFPRLLQTLKRLFQTFALTFCQIYLQFY